MWSLIQSIFGTVRSSFRTKRRRIGLRGAKVGPRCATKPHPVYRPPEVLRFTGPSLSPGGSGEEPSARRRRDTAAKYPGVRLGIGESSPRAFEEYYKIE